MTVASDRIKVEFFEHVNKKSPILIVISLDEIGQLTSI